MALPPFSSPKTFFADLRAFFRTRERHELIFAGFAVLIPAIFMLLFLSDSRPVDYKPPDVIFVQQWNKSRTDAEIKRQQAIDAPTERAARKAEADSEAKRRQEFKDLQKALGI